MVFPPQMYSEGTQVRLVVAQSQAGDAGMNSRRKEIHNVKPTAEQNAANRAQNCDSWKEM